MQAILEYLFIILCKRNEAELVLLQKYKITYIIFHETTLILALCNIICVILIFLSN